MEPYSASSRSTRRRRRPTRSTTTRWRSSSASTAAWCRASTSTPTSATPRREWGARLARAGHDARPASSSRSTTAHRSTSSCPDGRPRAPRRRRASCAPRAAATLGARRRRRPTQRDWPDVEQVADPPPAAPEVLVPGTRLRARAPPLPRRQHAAVPRRRPRGRSRSTRSRASPIPGGSCATPTTCCPPTSGSARGSTWSPWCSTTTWSTTARRSPPGPSSPRSGSTRATASCELDVLHLADVRPVARTTHTAIYRPAAPPRSAASVRTHGPTSAATRAHEVTGQPRPRLAWIWRTRSQRFRA